MCARVYHGSSLSSPSSPSSQRTFSRAWQEAGIHSNAQFKTHHIPRKYWSRAWIGGYWTHPCFFHAVMLKSDQTPRSTARSHHTQDWTCHRSIQATRAYFQSKLQDHYLNLDIHFYCVEPDSCWQNCNLFPSKVIQALGSGFFFLKRRQTSVERKSDPAMRTKDCTLFRPRYQTLGLGTYGTCRADQTLRSKAFSKK